MSERLTCERTTDGQDAGEWPTCERPAGGQIAGERLTCERPVGEQQSDERQPDKRQLNERDAFAYIRPSDIEAQSFQIIGDELGLQGLDPAYEAVLKRVIHTTADFDYAQTLRCSEHAIECGIEALKAGATVVTDTTMVAAGINKRVLERFGGEVRTFIVDADVAREAKERGITRSAVSMEHAARLSEPLIFALGNAPTALARVAHMIQDGTMHRPRLVIGVPVGFVNVVESKELIMSTDVDFIVTVGRKGGSNVAAAIVNALLYLASDGRRE